MKIDIEKQEKNIVKLNIEVEADAVSQEYSKACKKISEYVSIPGFRKGKAPRNMVEKHVSQEQIQKETLDRLLPNVFAEAISENQFEVITEPVVESFDFELGKPLSVVAKLELKPEINLNEYKGLDIEIEKFSQNKEEATEKELTTLREKFASVETVKDRASTATDIVMIDFDGTVNDEKIQGGEAKNYQLDLANSNFIPGFADQLVGKNIGEEFTIDVTFPQDYHDENLKGQPAKFEIKINEIKAKVLPEANDELAQKVGAFETIEELKKDISDYIEKQEEMENKNRSQNAVLDKVIEQAEIEIPESMVSREAKVLMEEIKQKVTMQGMEWEQFLDSQGHDKIWDNLKDEAHKRVKNSLVLGEIAKVEDVKVDDKQFEAKIKEMAGMYNTDEKTLYGQISKTPGMAQSIIQQIMSQNIVEFLVANNNINYVEKN